MSLELKEQHGMLNVYGKISANNMGNLENRMQQLLQKKEHIILSIERVEQIDTKAAFMLEKLYKTAAVANKVLAIMGRQNQHIAATMAKTKTTYIFSSDRV